MSSRSAELNHYPAAENSNGGSGQTERELGMWRGHARLLLLSGAEIRGRTFEPCVRLLRGLGITLTMRAMNRAEACRDFPLGSEIPTASPEVFGSPTTLG